MSILPFAMSVLDVTLSARSSRVLYIDSHGLGGLAVTCLAGGFGRFDHEVKKFRAFFSSPCRLRPRGNWYLTHNTLRF